MTSNNTRSHAFFYAVVLMTLLVVGTIVVYFLILPRAIPKQIIVAALPFDGPEHLPKHMTHAFPKHLTELVALSRELTVIDFDEARAALELGERFRGFTEELGATHIVDGEFVEDAEEPGNFVLTVRVVNVTQLAWKLRWDEQYHYPEQSLAQIRDQAAAGVLKGLYDNSVGEIPIASNSAENFEGYLEALWLADSGNRTQAQQRLVGLPHIESNPYALHLLSTLLPDDAEKYVELALSADPNHYPSLIEHAKQTYRKDGDLAQYLQTITALAGKYPNSEAVKEMADLYHALGWYDEEEQLLFRWVKMRPRSGEAALAMAFSRFRRGDDQQVQEALRIAYLRDPNNPTVQRYRALYELEVDSVDPSPLEEPGYRFRYLAINGLMDEAIEVLETMGEEMSCDESVEAGLYVGDLDRAFRSLECAERLWTTPPVWWQESDARWEEFTSDERYSSWLEERGLRESAIAGLEPASVEKLFAPIRKVLKPSEDFAPSSDDN
ncbi:MAG: hypothetical protein OXG08_12240 [Gammaproteobacteria bacterium]|nr:hypothetical protein [Gammaproteobacteria bacterium]